MMDTIAFNINILHPLSDWRKGDGKKKKIQTKTIKEPFPFFFFIGSLPTTSSCFLLQTGNQLKANQSKKRLPPFSLLSAFFFYLLHLLFFYWPTKPKEKLPSYVKVENPLRLTPLWGFIDKDRRHHVALLHKWVLEHFLLPSVMFIGDENGTVVAFSLLPVKHTVAV